MNKDGMGWEGGLGGTNFFLVRERDWKDGLADWSGNLVYLL